MGRAERRAPFYRERERRAFFHGESGKTSLFNWREKDESSLIGKERISSISMGIRNKKAPRRELFYVQDN